MALTFLQLVTIFSILSTTTALQTTSNDQPATNKDRPSTKTLGLQNNDELTLGDISLFKFWSPRALELVAETLNNEVAEQKQKPIVGANTDEIDKLFSDLTDDSHKVKYTDKAMKADKDAGIVAEVFESDFNDQLQGINRPILETRQKLQKNISEKIENLRTVADDTLNRLNVALNHRVQKLPGTQNESRYENGMKDVNGVNNVNDVYGVNDVNDVNGVGNTWDDRTSVEKRNIWSFMNANNRMACEMDVIHTSLTFTENIDMSDGPITLTCRGNVRVNKCEGMCSSSVTPDVNHYDGYLKQCSCCRDSSVRQRDVTLRDCSVRGGPVSGQFLTRTIIEPTTCACLNCRG